MVFLSLPGGKQVAAVCGGLAGVERKPGLTVVDLSTTSVADARAVAARLAEQGHCFRRRARRAHPPGGDRRHAVDHGRRERRSCSPASRRCSRYMGSDVTHCGDVGCGQVVKLINNCLLFENVAALPK